MSEDLQRENAELRATIEHLHAVCRLAVSDGHATPYLTHMIDQATKAHPDPRRVETAEELEALPEGAAILRTDDDSAESGVVTVGGYVYWSQVGPQTLGGLASEIAHQDDLKVCVLWTPEVSP